MKATGPKQSIPPLSHVSQARREKPEKSQSPTCLQQHPTHDLPVTTHYVLRLIPQTGAENSMAEAGGRAEITAD
jgi:hypothetical protein